MQYQREQLHRVSNNVEFKKGDNFFKYFFRKFNENLKKISKLHTFDFVKSNESHFF